MPMIPLGPPAGGGLPMPPGPPGLPLGAPPMGMGGPVALPPPPVPAAQAGAAALSLVPQQTAEQQAMDQQHWQQVIATVMDQLSNAPNPAAEAAQGMPAAQVTPDAGVPPQDTSITAGGY